MALKINGQQAMDGSTFVTITDGAGNLLPNPGNSSLSNLTTGQVSVGTTATLIVAARAIRNAVTVVNLGTVDIFLGGPSVTTTTGALLAGAKGSSMTFPVNTAIYGIVATGTQAVSYVESY